MKQEDIEQFYLSIDHKQEEEISKKKAYTYYDKQLFKQENIGSVEHLKHIHIYLFEEVYGDFAGKIRTHDLSKDTTTFCKAMYLPDNLKTVEKMKQDSFDSIVDKYVEMNMMHPFYEGNGRSTRIWLDNILISELQQAIDWTKVPKNLYLNCMKESVFNATNLKLLFESALTSKINDRELYMKGIDASYDFEGLNQFSMKNLLKKTRLKKSEKGRSL